MTLSKYDQYLFFLFLTNKFKISLSFTVTVVFGIFGVDSVKRFTKKQNEPTKSYLLTFEMQTLPIHITVGLYQMKNDMFVSNPLRCFKCQRVDHGQRACRGFETSFRFGEEGHNGKNCYTDPVCKMCKVNHQLYAIFLSNLRSFFLFFLEYFNMNVFLMVQNIFDRPSATVFIL